MSVCKILFILFRGFFVSRSNLILENLALHQQLTVQQRVKNMGIREVFIAPKSPWQNPYRERVIGSIRRECLDHFIILSENHLCRILKDYMDNYNNCRTHLSLKKNSPESRDVQEPEKGKVVSIPKVGGLHHLYKRVA